MAPTPTTDTTLTPVEDTSAASTTKIATPIDPELERCAVATTVNGDALELFAVGDDAELYHRTERRSSSTAWASLGRPAALRGGPTAIRTVLGGLLLAACADDGQFHVRLRRTSTKWDAWQAVAAPEGGCAWQPTLLLGADGGIHAFATTPGSGRLWEASWGRDGPPTTPTWGFLSGEASAVPSAELDADGLAHLFVRGPAGALFERAQTRGGGWGEWVALGGGAASSARPPSLAGAQHLMELYVRGKDDGLYRVRQAPVPPPQRTKWQRWEALGGAFASGAAAALNADGLAQVFAIGPDRAVWHRRQLFTAGSNASEAGSRWWPRGAPVRPVVEWSRWGSLGAEASAAPAAVQRADGLIDVLVRGADRNLYRKPQVLGAAGTNLSWGAWAFVGGPVRSFEC